MRPGRIVDRATRLEKRRFAAGVSHLSLICRTQTSQQCTNGQLPGLAEPALRPNTTPSKHHQEPYQRGRTPPPWERRSDGKERYPSPRYRLTLFPPTPSPQRPNARTKAMTMPRGPNREVSDKEGTDKGGSIRKGRLTKGLVMKERIGDEGQISKEAKGRLEQKGQTTTRGATVRPGDHYRERPSETERPMIRKTRSHKTRIHKPRIRKTRIHAGQETETGESGMNQPRRHFRRA